MKAKRFLVWLLAGTMFVPFCACGKVPDAAPVETPTEGPLPTTTREVPDYMSELKKHLGVDPAPSTFEEVKALAKSRQQRGYYSEDEDHHCCELMYGGNHYYVIRYEKAQEWFMYRFKAGTDYLSYEMDSNGTLIIKDDSYSGPEGMLMPYSFRAFVDESRRFLMIAIGYENVPYIPDADIAAFKGVLSKNTFISVKEFKEYYSMNDSKIDDEIIENYIRINHLSSFSLKQENHREILENIIAEGRYDKLGFAVWKLDMTDNKVSAEEFIKDAKLIYFEFEFPVPKSNETKTENLIFDLWNNKVYFNADTDNYRDAEARAELKDEALKSIREDLLKNVGPDDGNKYHDLKYSYLVCIIDSEGKYMRFTVRARNSVNTLFDTYWRTLYKMCFGKDHKLNTKGFDPEQNIKRRLYHSQVPTLN